MAAKLKTAKAPSKGASGSSKSPKKPANGAGKNKEMTAPRGDPESLAENLLKSPPKIGLSADADHHL